MNKTLQESKDAFYVLCQQYNQLGMLMQAEAEAAKDGRLQSAVTARECFFSQFDEFGEQMKMLGTAIDAQGGEPVLHASQNQGEGLPAAPETGHADQMRKVAKAVEDTLPDGFGFLVFTFPFKGMMDAPRLSYVSNSEREDAIKATKEWLFNQGEDEAWMDSIR